MRAIWLLVFAIRAKMHELAQLLYNLDFETTLDFSLILLENATVLIHKSVIISSSKYSISLNLLFESMF